MMNGQHGGPNGRKGTRSRSLQTRLLRRSQVRADHLASGENRGLVEGSAMPSVAQRIEHQFDAIPRFEGVPRPAAAGEIAWTCKFHGPDVRRRAGLRVEFNEQGNV